jgi:4-aminobutyrate aminotransferase-like enzyme
MVKLNTAQTLRWLRQYESRNVTFIDPDGSWPIVWERAKGVHVWDAEGKKYLDLTAAFGVAATGHANPRVVAAAISQMKRLLHAMGDVHPHAIKAALARELSRITFERWTKQSRSRTKSKTGRSLEKDQRLTGKTLFCNSGFEAVEAALKTAILATGKRGIIAFENAYHGLGYGALNVTFRAEFRSPFLTQLGRFGHFIPYPESQNELSFLEQKIGAIFKRQAIGAILVEPVQGRAGTHIPPLNFLPLLRRLCDRHGALLVADEIYTGFGRTGAWFACEYSHAIPDLICLGKALTGGFPLSACVGRAGVMDRAWPETRGEAMHTSTFLGHPAGCAMALAQIKELTEKHLVQQSAAKGEFLLSRLNSIKPPSGFAVRVRGIGLMASIEVTNSNGRPAAEFVNQTLKQMLAKRCILLPEGAHGNILSFTPPLTISEGELEKAIRQLQEIWAS